ncbi:type 1 glutamine amidotransferase [Marinobacter sp. R17]|uniref:type 1 glutamine amidotransferase domain-containing protein n=1 Tax=Marinobacter sp. R17 TaxID=2484250 RepID=UPI000F4BB7E0|nr:type 1 glutamine amidotransferase domain-containing protein [Marinobacter sp. R17]ROU00689.1 type 1 glutamine amidotransferase [Marinobacter sp. R17]
MSAPLNGKRVAFLATDGVEQIELTRPWQDLQGAGAALELISLEDGDIQGYHHLDKAHTFKVDKTAANANADDYDALVLPGGVANPDALRTDTHAVKLIKQFCNKHKPVAAICHAPWTLIEADQVEGRTLTSFPSLKTDIQNAGGHWVDEPVHNDNGLITSRVPDDLDAFCAELIEVLSPVA